MQLNRFSLNNLLLWLISYTIIFYIQLNYYLSFIIFTFPIVGFFLALKSRKSGFLFYLFTIFIFDDYSYNTDKSLYFSSIDTQLIAGQTVAKLWALVWIFILFFDFLKGKIFLKKSSIKNIMIYLLISSIIIGFINGNYNYFKEMINDSRIFINFFIGFIGVLLYFKENQSFNSIIKPIGLILIAKMLIIFIFTLILLQTNTIYTVASDTGFYLIPTFIIIFSIFGQTNSKLLSYLGIFLCMIMLGISASRGKIIILLIQLFMYLYAIGKLTKSPVYLLLLILPISIVPLISPEIFRFLVWKLTSVSVDPSEGISTYIRYVELKNIIALNFDNIFNFIFGSGLGGYWDSLRHNYGISLFNIDAYPDEWILNDKFFKPHGNIIFFLLKFGIIGTIIFYCNLFLNFIKHKKIYNKYSFSFEKNLIGKYLIAIFTGVITISIVGYSSKLQLFFGVFVAIVSQLKFQMFAKKNIKIYDEDFVQRSVFK